MTRIAAVLISVCCLIAVSFAQSPHAFTIRAGLLLDGRGGSARNTLVTIDGDRVVHVGSGSTRATYDLSRLTVLPGFIDTHVHILWHFGRDGRFDNAGE